MRELCGRRGQTFVIDLALSVAIFLIVLTWSSFLWSSLRSDVQDVEERNDLSAVTYSAADALIYSGGYPLDWNASSVQSLGFAQDYQILSLGKLVSALDLSYGMLRPLAGVGQYNARFYFTYNSSVLKSGIVRPPAAYFASNNIDLFSFLNASNVTWDFYWSGGALPAGDYRANYTGSDASSLFDLLLSNQSQYNTILVEDAPFSWSEVNISRVQGFLNNGGVLVYEGEGEDDEILIGRNFSMSFVDAETDANGVVQSPGFFLRNASVGESVSFAYSEWSFFRNASKNDVAPTIFVANASDSTKALVASWPYGRGVVYYLADSRAIFGGSKNASAVLNLVGWNLDYGIALPANATQVFIVQRPLLIQNDFRQPALFHLIVWS